MEEQESISQNMAWKRTIRAVAKEISQSPSTISHEIKRNCRKSGYPAYPTSQREKTNAASRIRERVK